MLGQPYTHHQISRWETASRSPNIQALSDIARALNVSLDYLAGDTDDPTSARDRDFMGFVPIHTEAAQAGLTGGTVVTTDNGPYPFRRRRLDHHSIDPQHSRVFRVQGDSMVPTLPDGAAILVDYSRATLEEGHIYLFRYENSLLVKRAAKSAVGDWLLASDNRAYQDIDLGHDIVVWGEVVWTGYGTVPDESGANDVN